MRTLPSLGALGGAFRGLIVALALALPPACPPPAFANPGGCGPGFALISLPETLHPSIAKARDELFAVRPDFALLIDNFGLLQKLHLEQTVIDHKARRLLKVPGFLRFATEEIAKDPGQTAAQVLQKYRERLGTRNWTRGLALTEDEAKTIEKNGMEANFLRSGGSLEEAKHLVLTNGLPEMIRRHLGYDGVGGSPFLSVTGDIDTAQNVAVTSRAKFGKSVAKIYLVSLTAWNLDTIEVGNSVEALLFGRIPIVDSIRPSFLGEGMIR